MRYTVKSGDTLWDLARKNNTTVDELLRMNPHISDRNKIYAGRSINLPDAPMAYKAAASGSSPVAVSSPDGQAANLAQDGTIRPPLFPEAMANPQPQNPVQQDAQAASQGMDAGMMDPTQFALLGGTVAANAITKAIPALAKAAPAALPQAGQVAIGAGSNVMPIQGAQGAAAAMLNSTEAQTAGRSLPEMIQWYLQQAGQNAAKNWGF